MTGVRITKLERDERGFFTANVTATAGDTVRVDSRIGCWTVPIDPKADHASNQIRRREILPDIAAALWKRVRSLERGETVDEAEEINTKGRRTLPPLEAVASTRRDAAAIAAAMAQAGSDAVKRAA